MQTYTHCADTSSVSSQMFGGTKAFGRVILRKIKSIFQAQCTSVSPSVFFIKATESTWTLTLCVLFTTSCEFRLSACSFVDQIMFLYFTFERDRVSHFQNENSSWNPLVCRKWFTLEYISLQFCASDFAEPKPLAIRVPVSYNCPNFMVKNLF
jgi:hypothetical protein